MVARPQGSVEPLLRLTTADMAGVDRFITARMESSAPTIPALADHLISAGGKRLRPLIMRRQPLRGLLDE